MTKTRAAQHRRRGMLPPGTYRIKGKQVTYRNGRPEPLIMVRAAAIAVARGRDIALDTSRTDYRVSGPAVRVPFSRHEQIRRLHRWRDSIVTLDARVCARITQLEDEIAAGLE